MRDSYHRVAVRSGRLGLLLLAACACLGLHRSEARLPANGAFRSCRPVVNPYKGTKYDGVNLSLHRAEGVSCRSGTIGRSASPPKGACNGAGAQWLPSLPMAWLASQPVICDPHRIATWRIGARGRSAGGFERSQVATPSTIRR